MPLLQRWSRRDLIWVLDRVLDCSLRLVVLGCLKGTPAVVTTIDQSQLFSRGFGNIWRTKLCARDRGVRAIFLQNFRELALLPTRIRGNVEPQG